MARDRDGDTSGGNQSKQPAAAYLDLGDQPQQHLQQHHRARSQKHVVGGATGGRLHARIPSSKGLHKHHATTSTTKLNRKHSSLSPDHGGAAALATNHHRRATSELKLTSRDPSSANLRKNTSQTNLKRNRSHGEVGKKTKPATNLHRSVSNPAVHKLKSSGGPRVQFNLGDEDQDDEEDEDDWVDASSSASPLLSRRGSAAQSANPPTAKEQSRAASPTSYAAAQHPSASGPQQGAQKGAQSGAQNNTTTGRQTGNHSPPRNRSSLNQYITSRILSRTPSHGAPPMMSTENVSVRPPSIRQQSPPDSSHGHSEYLSHTPGTTTDARPGSSGKAELTSRFVGNNSQESGSGVGGESFILAANRRGLSRAAMNGKDDIDVPKRRRSLGALSQSRGIDALSARQGAADDNGSEDDGEHTARISRSRRSGEYVVPRDMNRTQQKLNLQRASSSLEPAHPHPGIGIGPPGVVAAGAGTLIGVPTTYDSRDPRIGRTLERTGMEYLTVRRHLNPVARSISRVMQLPGLENSRRIPQPPGGGIARHASRLSEQYNPNQSLTRDSSMTDLINDHHAHARSGSAGGGGGARGRRPPTPRSSGGVGSSGGAFSALQSVSSSLGSTDDGASRLHERHGHGRGGGHPTHHQAQQQEHGLSGSSLVDGAEDAGTVALLRMMWDKNMDLSASQD
ncbi:hypothetical protein N657DRAFT_565365 [Parathielavia appendiculata]|uniref:Uncharacterized protein n=1 Tax=Parathielavia appendiculata TaxID=2587402 RepID=A0AAN6U5N7_9PEZI|nr:hypothetical protein N657DRAFT_565365 [Parathielavia appendiculata]